VLQALPIIDGIKDLVSASTKLSKVQEKYGYDAVKLAMDKGTFDN
jgi:hypothetical protein